MLITRAWYHDHQPEPQEDMAFSEAIWRRYNGPMTVEEFRRRVLDQTGRHSISCARAVFVALEWYFPGQIGWALTWEQQLVMRGLLAYCVAAQARGEWPL